jgi:hypothetical protein
MDRPLLGELKGTTVIKAYTAASCAIGAGMALFYGFNPLIGAAALGGYAATLIPGIASALEALNGELENGLAQRGIPPDPMPEGIMPVLAGLGG